MRLLQDTHIKGRGLTNAQGSNAMVLAKSQALLQMLRQFRRMREFADIKVVLRTPEGEYLAGSGINPCFVRERSRAIVLDYFADRVEDKIANLRDSAGLVFTPVALPPTEVYESCDLCHRLLMPRQVFFDGIQFLCPGCRGEADAKLPIEHLAAA